MSLRIDTAEWIAGALLIGNVGSGVLAEDLAATGDNGSGFLFDDVTLPADAGKEICGRITYWPPGLTMAPDEDGGITATGGDGTYVALYQLYVDYVATGPETAINFQFGVAGSISAAAAWTEGADSFALAGAVEAPAVTAAAAWVESPDVAAIVASVAGSIEASASWAEGADISAIGGAVETFYTRAPSGSGYSPRRDERQARPASGSSSRPSNLQTGTR